MDAALGQVGGLAADAYKGDNLSTVNVLLGSRSPGDLVNGLELLDRFAHRQHEQVRSVAALRDELAAKKKPLDEMIAGLARTEAQLAAKKKQIDAEIAKLQKLRLKVYGKGGGGPLRPAPCPAGYPGGAGRGGGASSPAPRSARSTSGAPPARTTSTARASPWRPGPRAESRCRTTRASSTA